MKKNETKNFENIVGFFIVEFTTPTNFKHKYAIRVERFKSGFDYGDNSYHAIYLDGVEFKVFDTRYDHISTNLKQWKRYWNHYLKYLWSCNKKVKVETIKALVKRNDNYFGY